MSGGGWGCPHEADGRCGKVNMLRCDPGMKGCELFGRYAFFDDSTTARLRQKQANAAKAADQAAAPAGDADAAKE